MVPRAKQAAREPKTAPTAPTRHRLPNRGTLLPQRVVVSLSVAEAGQRLRRSRARKVQTDLPTTTRQTKMTMAALTNVSANLLPEIRPVALAAPAHQVVEAAVAPAILAAPAAPAGEVAAEAAVVMAATPTGNGS